MGKKIILALMFLFLFSFVAGQELEVLKHESQGTAYFIGDGFTVNVLHPEMLQIGENFYIYMSFYDKNGKLQDKDDAECLIGILSPKLDRVVLYEEQNMTFIYNNSIFIVEVDGSFINESGYYSYNFNCDDGTGTVGGYSKGILRATHSGLSLDTSGAIIYLLMTFFLMFIMGLLLWGYFLIPNDTRDDDGFVLEVSKLKYIKPVLLGLAWIMFCSITFIVANISIAYLDAELIGSFLFGIWQIMMLSNLVILPLCIIRMIQRIVLGKEMLGLIERGVKFS